VAAIHRVAVVALISGWRRGAGVRPRPPTRIDAAGVGNYARKPEMVEEIGIFFVWSGHPTN
jgi:hypothetical protein